MDKNQHIARLLESTKTSPDPTSRLCFWKKKQQRSQFIVVCLHVHQIAGLPPASNGQFITVGWKAGGSEREKTIPAEVCEGAACFDEVFLHYCNGIEDARSVLKGIIVSVSLVDAEDCKLGDFKIDLSEVVLVENLNPKYGGKMVSLDLDGIANGGVLSVGVYCRMLEEEEEDNNIDSCSKNESSKKQSKNKCFSCLPDFQRLRIRPKTDSVRRIPKVRSITVENSIRKHAHPQDNEDEDEDEGEGFITIEKGVFHARPRNPPSDDLRNTDDDEEFEDVEDEKVQDEFLRMLEVKYWKKAEKGGEGSLSYLSLDLDVDLDSLVKEAEVEMNRAAQMWKRRVGGEKLEREEYEELMKRWGSNENAPCYGFGSPF